MERADISILPRRIKELQTVIEYESILDVVDRLDVFAVIIKKLKSLDESLLVDAWQIIQQIGQRLRDEIRQCLDGPKDLALQAKLLEAFYAVIRIDCGLLESCIEASKNAASAIVTGTTKGSRKKTQIGPWMGFQADMLACIVSLYELPFLSLCDNTAVDEEIVELITNVAFKQLENPAITNDKQMVDDTIRLLAAILKAHGASFGCTLKLVQLLQFHEHLPSILVEMMDRFVNKFGIRTIIPEMFREIGYLEKKNVEKEGLHAKSISSFLVELAHILPDLVATNIDSILCLLDHDNHVLRNGVLSTSAAVIMKKLNGESLQTEEKEKRDELLEHLLEHVHDVNAFVRSNVLQLWVQLTEEKVVPLTYLIEIMKRAKGRFLDKSSLVRKNAIAFFTVLLRCNPFASQFSTEEIAQNLKNEETKLEALKVEHLKATKTNENVLDEDNADPNEENENEQNIEEALSNLHLNNEENSNLAKDDGLKAQEKIVFYLKSMLEFTTCIYEVIPLSCQLLDSQLSSDAVEAVRFIIECYKFGLMPAVEGIRHMLLLIWSNEKAVKDAIIVAYKDLYITSKTIKGIEVRKLIDLAAGATMGELLSLEELITQLILSGQMSSNNMNAFWTFFTSNTEKAEERKIALLYFAMAANIDPHIIQSKIPALLDAGFKNVKDDNDLMLILYICGAIMKLRKKQADEMQRFCNSHAIFEQLKHILQKMFLCRTVTRWIPVMESSLNLIYCLADQPQILVQEFLLQLISQCYDEIQGEQDMCTSYVLTRLIATIGHVALKQLIYLDVHVFNAWKKSQEKPDVQKKRRKSLSASIARKSLSASVSKYDSTDTETELFGAVADDAEAECIHKIMEMDLVIGDSSMLAQLMPLITSICKDPNKYADMQLQAASTLALAKCMLVSSEFCRSNLQLLFSILEKSPEPVVRANVVVAIGDLALRFPNLIDPWSDYIYQRIQDENIEVRLNTLTVLCNLILNDMVKAKGQISEIAKCIADENEIVAQFAQKFFAELGKQENIIYNMLPAIINQLTDAKSTEEDEFKIIMKFLFNYINKDRQIVGLVEKICHRFQVARETIQCQQLAFCLSLLPKLGKGIQTLQENLNAFADKLVDDVVYNHFVEILNKSKKGSKQEQKGLLDEFEEQLNAARAKACDETLAKT